jgi:MFS transporter, YNFM family, putative membrane transport protein
MLAHFRNPRLLATFAVGFGMLFTLVGSFTFITFYLADPPFNLSTAALSYLFAIYLIGLIVTPGGGYLVTRIGMRAGIAVAICASLAGVLLTLSHSLWIVVLAGLGLVCTGVFIAQATANSLPAPRRRARNPRLGGRPLHLLLLHGRNRRRRHPQPTRGNWESGPLASP